MGVTVDTKGSAALRNVRKTFSDETVTVAAMQLVKAATGQQEYVTQDVFLDGEEHFATKNA